MTTNRMLAALACAVLMPAVAPAAEDPVARGEYLSRIMDCGGCHTPRGPDGALDQSRPLSGGTIGFEIPGLGVFWPPNLTNDATGLAGWTDEQIAAAIRHGERPDGRVLAPIMPWESYAVISDDDLRALTAYLRSLDGIANQVPAPIGPGQPAAAPYFKVQAPG